MERAIWIKRGGTEHERATVGVGNRTWPIKDKERGRWNVWVGPGLRECNAGYETNNCGEFRVRWSGLLHSKGGGRTRVPR